MIKISEQSSFLLNPNIAEIEKCISCNTSVIIFDNICEQTEILENLLSNTFINSIILVSKKKNNLSNKKVIYTSKINKKSIRLLSTNILILTNLNNNYEYSKFIVTNIFNLLKNAKKMNKNINNIICSIFNKSIYLEDIINCFTAILIEDRKKQYEFIYDTACDYLDNQFNKKIYVILKIINA